MNITYTEILDLRELVRIAATSTTEKREYHNNALANHWLLRLDEEIYFIKARLEMVRNAQATIMIPLGEDSQLDQDANMARFTNKRSTQIIWNPYFKASTVGELARYHEAHGRSPNYPFEWAPGEKEKFYERASRICLGDSSNDSENPRPSTPLSTWKRTEQSVLRYVRKINAAGKQRRSREESFEMPGDDGELDPRAGDRHPVA